MNLPSAPSGGVHPRAHSGDPVLASAVVAVTALCGLALTGDLAAVPVVVAPVIFVLGLRR